MTERIWEDTYDLAYRMYGTSGGIHRSDLDVLDRAVADKSARIIKFDEFTEVYELRVTEASINQPIEPLVRGIAQCDVEEMKRRQQFTSPHYPKVIYIKLLHALPPNGIIAFNCEHQSTIVLENTLQYLVDSLKPALIGDLFPGAILLRKNNNRVFRIMILGQNEDNKYNVLLIDHGVVGESPIENLFMIKPAVDLSKFPCALIFARIRGFPRLTKSAFEEIQKSMDNWQQKERIKAVIFQKDEQDNNFVIDFKAFSYLKMSVSEQISLNMKGEEDGDDPKLIPLDIMKNMQISSNSDTQMRRVSDSPKPVRKLRLPPKSADML